MTKPCTREKYGLQFTALTVLTYHVSTIASKSAFSTGDGDISHPFTRSRARAHQSSYLGLWMDDTCPAPASPASLASRANPT